MKRFLLAVVSLLPSFFSFGQADSVAFVDSNYVEERPNYFGANIAPIFTNAFGNTNANIKASFMYKRNFGLRNLRASFNYLTQANQSEYSSYVSIASTDSTITNRYYNSISEGWDVRFGFEELRGYESSRFHIGADVLFGKTKFTSIYDEIMLYQDSTGYFLAKKDELPLYQGSHNSNFYTAGIDLSFGFDWMVAPEFVFTF